MTRRESGRETGLFDPAALEAPRVLAEAAGHLAAGPFTITAHRAPESPGGAHDYYSNGDYWWPNPDTPEGLPYVRRDGERNPGFFFAHRQAMIGMKKAVAGLATAWLVSGGARWARRAGELLDAFFLDPATRMNPRLDYAQAIPGVCTGRGIGIIDTLHLVEVTEAAGRLGDRLPADTRAGLRAWFAAYLDWLTSHHYGLQEQEAANNHGTAWVLQVGAFASFAGRPDLRERMRGRYRQVLLERQMAADGRFPLELERTKPYGYSIFNLELFTLIAQVLSDDTGDLFRFRAADGRGLDRGWEFLFPFLEDRKRWRLGEDVEDFEAQPGRVPGLLFAGLALGRPEYLRLWRRLRNRTLTGEGERNSAAGQPLLWLRPFKR